MWYISLFIQLLYFSFPHLVLQSPISFLLLFCQRLGHGGDRGTRCRHQCHKPAAFLSLIALHDCCGVEKKGRIDEEIFKLVANKKGEKKMVLERLYLWAYISAKHSPISCTGMRKLHWMQVSSMRAAQLQESFKISLCTVNCNKCVVCLLLVWELVFFWRRCHAGSPSSIYLLILSAIATLTLKVRVWFDLPLNISL